MDFAICCSVLCSRSQDFVCADVHPSAGSRPKAVFFLMAGCRITTRTGKFELDWLSRVLRALPGEPL
jgi:hypothetical protein